MAGYGFFVHEQKVDQFRSKTDATGRQRCLEKNGTVVDRDGKTALRDCFDLRSEYRSAQTVMFGGLVAAGLLATGALALWAFGPDGRSERASAGGRQRWALGWAPGAGWAAWSVAF